MKSLTTLWQEAASELAAWCDTSTTRDVKTLRARVDAEGISFLTITLPNFGSDFERSLDRGFVGSDLFYGFHRKGGLPVFLRGFLCQIFDEKTGVLQTEPNVDAIFAVRQLTLMCKKIQLPCSPEREKKALDRFVQCEEELRMVEDARTGIDNSRFRVLAAILFGDVFDAVNTEVESFALDPSHGPGATADKKVGNQKFNQSEWTDRMEPYFPFGEYVLPSWRHISGQSVKFLRPWEERPSKVRSVPKTLKTPRLICVEPTATQYAQQGLLRSLVPKLETLTPSRYFVGFTDQEPNQLLAQEGSLSGDLATLDLSEASDRVLNSLVIDMLKPWPSLSGAVQACRSEVTELPDGQRIRLTKFASMGSALCFPIEAIVFTTLVMMGIEVARNTRFTRSSFEDLRGQVRVYGDDIIVPIDCVTEVIRHLEDYGLKVNATKSFWNGKFRESCGGDFYAGQDVKPVRVTQKPPISRRDAEELIAWTAMSNAFHLRGMWKTARFAASVVEKVLGPLTCVSMNSNSLGLHSFTGTQPERWDPKLHRFLVRTWKIQSQIPRNELSGIGALRKTLSRDWSDPAYKEHLLRSGRSLSVNIKRGWEPAVI